ncbi:hypothetical protein BU17DRAFT_57044 [Hysterangium stoloniferum]|nr:hypothetical protein BU17DRAFT_57044 [Hysterangium stoloniferum]
MEVSLPNGEKVRVNDHVYCSPNWAVRDGTPYSIARIMEFLTAEGTTRGIRAKTKDAFTRVRVAWYYRPSDVSDRQVADSRLLLCAIYSEVIPITQLRAKCYVRHKDRIADLAAWKKRPDRFYYNRLFDPFIKREFEVILTADIHNLPRHIKDELASRYDMIVTEKECVAELTDSLRLCDTCSEWCPSSDSVQCDTCKSHFHMACVQPPLLAKPARGYGWSCARCAHNDDEESGQATPGGSNIKPKSSVGAGSRPRGRPKGSRNTVITPAKQQEETEAKYYKMWPFRYFGQYTIAEDTLDPEDIIFPRANTRVGLKFQTTVPPTGSSLPVPGPDIPERGTDETIEILSCVSRMSGKECKHYPSILSWRTFTPESIVSVDWLTEAIRRLSVAYLQKEPFSNVTMTLLMRLPKWKKEEVRYTDRAWHPSEIHIFENAIQDFGPELRSVRDQISSRTVYEVVRFFTLWKTTHLLEENRRILEARKLGKASPHQPKPISRQPSAGMSEEEKSVVNMKLDGRSIAAFSTCAACRTRQTNVWWKAPKGLSTSVLCDDCGVHWRKYGDLNLKPPKEENLPSAKQRAAILEKREGTPMAGPVAKRAKMSVISTPPALMVKHVMCQCCKKSGAIGKVIKCIQCCMGIHAGVCGATSGGSLMDSTEAEAWLCDVCQNETSLEASLVSDCVLCPRRRKDDKKKSGPVPKDEMDMGFLRARKPTESQGWVHILCSLFAPEVVYADASRLRLVEGVSSIAQSRWESVCSICHRTGGVCVKCAMCVTEYHPACAWKLGHRFTFEMQGVKANKRDTTVQVDFKRDIGAMTPVVFCKTHSPGEKRLHDFCDMNERGETALQVYTKNYKQVPLDNSYRLLRKARRLDAAMEIISEKNPSRVVDISISDTRCHNCGTEYSPFFHPVKKETSQTSEGRDNPIYECHCCYMEKATVAAQRFAVGPMAIEA